MVNDFCEAMVLFPVFSALGVHQRALGVRNSSAREVAHNAIVPRCVRLLRLCG